MLLRCYTAPSRGTVYQRERETTAAAAEEKNVVEARVLQLELKGMVCAREREREEERERERKRGTGFGALGEEKREYPPRSCERTSA